MSVLILIIFFSFVFVWPTNYIHMVCFYFYRNRNVFCKNLIPKCCKIGRLIDINLKLYLPVMLRKVSIYKIIILHYTKTAIESQINHTFHHVFICMLFALHILIKCLTICFIWCVQILLMY